MAESFDIVPLANWSGVSATPFVIAGPCSAETEEQVRETVRQICLHSPRVHFIRAGIWKPRTRPNAFEGVGEKGLPWLKTASLETGLPVCVEVATPEHVELALKHGIDSLWVGARTTVSPFNVQALADALKGVDIPVFIKNPVNPDLELWIGAIERFYYSGLKKLVAIHRGFSVYERSIYRNPPMWELPIELRRRHPEVPILVDPSHMGGSRELIYPLSQLAMDMGFEGLMIETHHAPDRAWSDANQQLSPAALAEVLNELMVRQRLGYEQHYATLQELRARIDVIDKQLVELLGRRMDISEEIGEFKREHNLAIHQSERWAHIMQCAIEQGRCLNLSSDFVLKVYQQIHNESIFRQTGVFRKAEEPGLSD